MLEAGRLSDDEVDVEAEVEVEAEDMLLTPHEEHIGGLFFVGDAASLVPIMLKLSRLTRVPDTKQNAMEMNGGIRDRCMQELYLS